MILPVRTRRLALLVGLAASSAPAAELVVQWAPLPAAVEGVQVERRVDDGGTDFAPIARVAGDATRFVDRGVSAGVRYCYRVRGLRGWSVSPPSAPLCNVASARAAETKAVASAQPVGTSANPAPAASAVQPPAPVASAAAAASNASGASSVDAPSTADANATLVTTDAALAMRDPTVQRTPFEPSAPALAASSASEPAASTSSAPAASGADAPRAAALDAPGASAARASGATTREPATLTATESAEPDRAATLDAPASPLASAAPARSAAASSPEIAAAPPDSVAVATPAPESREPAATAPAATLGASAPEAAPAASAAAPGDEVREVKPLHRPRPEYPPYAQLNGLSGWVKVRFTVAADGSTRDVQIVASEPARVFDASALGAARQFVYSPRLENGVAVDRPNVETEITYTWIQRGGAVVTEHVPQARR